MIHHPLRDQLLLNTLSMVPSEPWSICLNSAFILAVQPQALQTRLLLLLLCRNHSFAASTSICLLLHTMGMFSGLGSLIATLWWFNIDSFFSPPSDIVSGSCFSSAASQNDWLLDLLTLQTSLASLSSTWGNLHLQTIVQVSAFKIYWLLGNSAVYSLGIQIHNGPKSTLSLFPN